ncbi:MAG TPA: TIGR02281 family clan AA aspartic protease [Sphingobium sp.]|nr:TIGR02281 family clan AA aspartic protease [Sphingobium sp.]
MNEASDQAAQAIFLILVISMVASGLLARRLPLLRLMTWAVAWAIVIFIGFLLFRAVEPQITQWQQSRRGGEIIIAPDNGTSGTGSTSGLVQGNVIRIPMSGDGHYWVDAKLSGQNVRFLIDSGASITAISQQSASTLPLLPDPGTSMAVVQTANGPVNAQRAIIADMEIGPIRASHLPVLVSPAFGTMNVLGMNFLGKLKSWRVENGVMILEAK